MPGRVYPPAPVTAVGYGAQGHKDSIPAYTAEVPNLVYTPNVGGASYDKELALTDVCAVVDGRGRCHLHARAAAAEGGGEASRRP